MDEVTSKALELHKDGKIATVVPRRKRVTPETLPYFYTPHVAKVCKEFQANPSLRREYSHSGRTVAVISDGTRVLGLGDIGPFGAMPVMEGKSMLFISFTGGKINSFPLCLGTKDPEEFIRTVINVAPSFGAINLEDISQPKCFYILERLRDELRRLSTPIPVWHDDQQGTAAVVLAGLLNALKVAGKKIGDVQIVVNGAGAAGLRITDYLLLLGAKGGNIIVLDSKGAIYASREDMGAPESKYKKQLAADRTNPSSRRGALADVIAGADVLISASSPAEVERVITQDAIRKMNPNSVVFVVENPTPKQLLENLKAWGVRVLANGSFAPNQVNNMLVFPGIMWGVIDSGAKEITDEMVIAGVKALAASVRAPTETEIVPLPSIKVSRKIARAVAKAAKTQS